MFASRKSSLGSILSKDKLIEKELEINQELQECHMEFHRSHLLSSPPSYSSLFLVAYRNNIIIGK